MNKGWSDKQKRLMIYACKSVGIDDSTRHLLLYQLGGRAIVDSCATSTSPRLKQSDFEKLMHLIEGYSEGEQVLSYRAGYWTDQFLNGPYGRLLHRARALETTLQDLGMEARPILRKAIGRDFDLLYNLDEDELHKAIDAMTAVIKRKGAA